MTGLCQSSLLTTGDGPVRAGLGQGGQGMECVTDLAMHCAKLAVEGHGEICGGPGGHMRDKGGLALVDCIIHADSSLADVHVLEAGFNAGGEGRGEGKTTKIR